MDFSAIIKIREHWDTFKMNHPKVPVFINDIRTHGFQENQEISIAIRYPDGSEYRTGIRLKESDLDFINSIKAISKMI